MTESDTTSPGVVPSHRLEARRVIPTPPAVISAVLCDPDGHVAIDSSGMLQSGARSPGSHIDPGILERAVKRGYVRG